jgi:hypothetical protein
MFDVFVPIDEFSTFGSTEITVVKLAVVPLRIGKAVLEVTLLNEVALLPNSAVAIFDVNLKVVFKELVVTFSTFGSTEDTVVKLAVVPLRIGKSVLEVTLLNEVALIPNSAVAIFDVNLKVVFRELVVTFSTFGSTEDSVIKLAVVPLRIGRAVLEVTLLRSNIVALVVVIFDVNFEVVGSELVVVVILDNELAAVA